MIYKVYVTIHNSYEVEANSEYEAETKVGEMDAEQILNDSDFNVTEIEKRYHSNASTI
jgi:hypothetical protein